MSIDITHNPDEQRFEATIDGQLGVLMYQRSGNRIAFTHTQVPAPLRGQGVGGALAKSALDFASENQLQVLPLCSFVADYIERNPKYGSLLCPNS
jgi:hypothetical protein